MENREIDSEKLFEDVRRVVAKSKAILALKREGRTLSRENIRKRIIEEQKRGTPVATTH